jgi:hypothetical protein
MRLLLEHADLRAHEFDDPSRPFDGLMLLGCAREILLTPPSKPKEREKELKRIAQDFNKSLGWRVNARCETVRREGLDVRLVDGGCQGETHWYGWTHGGLPVVVDKGTEWVRAINACRRLNITPDEYAATRIYWHETCVGTTARVHAGGKGNGQFIHVIDFGGLGGLGLSDFYAAWPYIKASIVKVSLNYTGTARRIYVARPPRLFAFGWKLLKPLLVEKTRYKVVVLPSRSTQRIDDYLSCGKEEMTAIPPECLPSQLGGTCDDPIEPMHYVSDAARR